MARIFLDEMGGINQGGILASYGLPISPFSTEEYAPTIVETPGRPTRTRRKQSKPKPKRNDGIIRNHDSVWDYKIQDGKLLTRRKTSDGKWYDITTNEEARQRIENFTGRSIGQSKAQSKGESPKTPGGGPFGGKTYDELNAILEKGYPKSNATLPRQSGTLRKPRYRTIDTTVGAITPANNGGLVYPTGDGLYYISPKTKAIAEAHGETDMLGEYIPEGVVRREFTEPYMTSNDAKRTIADYVPKSAPGMNWLNYNIGYAIPGLGDSVRKAINRANLGDTNYINLMRMLGINVFAKGNERYYPM